MKLSYLLAFVIGLVILPFWAFAQYASDLGPLDLTAISSIENTDALLVGDASDASELLKQITWTNFKTALTDAGFMTSVSSSTVATTTYSGGYVLQASTTANGGLVWVATSTLGLGSGGSFLSNIVEDTTPQLGGNLDMNGSNISFPSTFSIVDPNSNNVLSFTYTASAVNYLRLDNAGTGAGPDIAALGTDTNIDLNLIPKGSGLVQVSGGGLDGADIAASTIATTSLNAANYTDGYVLLASTSASGGMDWVATSTLNLSGGSGGVQLSDNNAWTGTNSFAATTTFTGPVVYAEGIVATSTIYSNFGNIQIGSSTQETLNIDFTTADQIVFNSYSGVATATWSGMVLDAAGLGADLVDPDSVLSSGKTDEYCLTYEATGDTWEWQVCGAGGASDLNDLGDVVLTSTSTGDILYNNGSGDWVNLGIGTAGQVLSVSGGLPAWSNPTGGGSGAGWATTTDDVEVTYGSPVNPVYIGDSASTSAAFILDPRDSSLTIATTTAASASIALEGATVLNSVSGSLTLGEVDAIDATTETTFESAIDALTNLITVGTITTGTWAANLATGVIDAITEIDASLRSGSDATLITGTAGASSTIPVWDVNSDLIGTDLYFSSGALGIGTSSPQYPLVVDDGVDATSTLQIGGPGNVGCIQMRDSDDAGWSYGTVLDGVITWSSNSCG